MTKTTKWVLRKIIMLITVLFFIALGSIIFDKISQHALTLLIISGISLFIFILLGFISTGKLKRKVRETLGL